MCPSGIIGDRWNGKGASDEGGTSGWGLAIWTWTDAAAFGSTVGPKSLVSMGIVLSTDGRCSDCCRSCGLIQLDFGDCKSSVNFPCGCSLARPQRGFAGGVLYYLQAPILRGRPDRRRGWGYFPRARACSIRQAGYTWGAQASGLFCGVGGRLLLGKSTSEGGSSS